MGTLYWTGNAHAVADVWTATPPTPTAGLTYRLVINNKYVEYEAEDDDDLEDLVNALVDEVNESDIPEFTEIEAEAGTDDDGEVTHIVLTGRTAGVPHTITGTVTGASVTVSTIQNGAAAVNMKQTIRLPPPTSGGTFTLTFIGQTTGNIAWNASAATVETAFEGLSTVGAGNGTVTRTGSGTSTDPYVWEVEFTGSLAGTTQPLITGSGTNLTGAASISHATVTQGAMGTNEVQKVEYTPGAVFMASFRGQNSVPIYAAGGSSAFQTALTNMSSIGPGNVSVTASNDDTYYLIEFTGDLGFQSIGLSFLSGLVISQISGTITHTIQTAGSANVISEVQTFTLNGDPTGGTFTLNLGGNTGNIAYNATAGDVETALEALSLITSVTVTKSGSTFTVTFDGVDGGINWPQLTSTSSLTGGGVYVSITQSASAATNEIQKVTVDPAVTGGTFTLTFDGQTTGNIAYNASASTMDTALEALSNIGAGDITVTSGTTGQWFIEFGNAMAGANQVEMTADGANLTGGSSITLTNATAATGPWHWNNTANWSSGAIPVNSDDVYFVDSDVPCKYGLAQSAVTLTSLHIEASYTGQIGLPHVNEDGGYYEYRATYLAISATTVNIGVGEGGGASLIKINNGTGQTTWNIHNTGNSNDANLPAILWKGTHASNIVNLFRGSFGAAVFPGETATIATLRQGYQGDQGTDTSVYLGAGVTWTTYTKHGGEATINSGGTTLTNDGGELIVYGSGAITTIEIRGGTVYDRGTGTWTTLNVSAGGVYDRTNQMTGKTITNLTLHAGAGFLDPNKTLTYSNGIILSKCGIDDIEPFNVGTAVTLTVA